MQSKFEIDLIATETYQSLSVGSAAAFHGLGE